MNAQKDLVNEIKNLSAYQKVQQYFQNSSIGKAIKQAIGQNSNATRNNAIKNVVGSTYTTSQPQPTSSYVERITGVFSGASWSWISLGIYFFSILVVVGLVILFVHFFMTPVIQWRPGDPGFLLVPGWDNSSVFWKDGTATVLENKDLPIRSVAYGYTLQVYMALSNPLQFSTKPRVLFSRGGNTTGATGTGDSIKTVFGDYNLVVALSPDTNDLIVSTLNTANISEDIIIRNVPIQQPFCLTIVLMEKVMEVYVNGELRKTHTIQSGVKSVTGNIEQGSTVATLGKLKTLKLWPRPLTTGEIRSSALSLPSVSDMAISPMPSSSSLS